MPKWTPEDDAKLKELLEQGLSYWECGQAMGRNKNSCIGRGHRLGLMTATDPKVIDAKRARWSKKKPEAPKPKMEKPPMEAVVIPFPEPSPALRYEQPEASGTAFGQPKSIIGLREHHCRWPVHRSAVSDRWLFCAAERDGKSPYCEHHRMIAYRPTSRQVAERSGR